MRAAFSSPLQEGEQTEPTVTACLNFCRRNAKQRRRRGGGGERERERKKNRRATVEKQGRDDKKGETGLFYVTEPHNDYAASILATVKEIKVRRGEEGER